MHRTNRSISLAVALLLVLGLALAGLPRTALPVHGATLGNKSCHAVTKKVHGKKKKVKVCRVTAKPTPSPTATPVPTEVMDAATEAHGLVDELASASDASSKTKSLEDLLGALGIGVYEAATGKVVVHGDEESNNDFYLFDVEVEALAQTMLSSRTYSLDEAAGFLNALQILPNRPITGDALRSIVVWMAVAARADPQNDAAFLPDLIEDLSLSHNPSVDLSQDPPTAGIQLDALQVFLLEAQLLVPSTRSTAAFRPSISLADGNCEAVTPETKSEQNEMRQFVKKSLKAVGQLLDWGKKANGGEVPAELSSIQQALQTYKQVKVIIDALHGLVLAGGITATREDSGPLETHEGPKGHAAHAGDPLVFRLQVFMHFRLAQDTINCLQAAGYNIPAYGPIPKVPVFFDFKVDNDISKYGTLDPAPSSINAAGLSFTYGVQAVTGPDGVATMTFTPKDEICPPLGITTIDHGTVDAYALWGTALGNKLGTINQFLTPIFDTFGWDVGYHTCRNFELDASITLHAVVDSNVQSTFAIHHQGHSDYSASATVHGLALNFSSPSATSTTAQVLPTYTSSFSGMNTTTYSGSTITNYQLTSSENGTSARVTRPVSATLSVQLNPTGTGSPPSYTLALNPGDADEIVHDHETCSGNCTGVQTTDSTNTFDLYAYRVADALASHLVSGNPKDGTATYRFQGFDALNTSDSATVTVPVHVDTSSSGDSETIDGTVTLTLRAIPEPGP